MSEIELKRMEEAITKAVIESFEEMAFLEVIRVDGGEEELDSAALIRIEIVKPFIAVIILKMSEGLKGQIAENIYCKDSSQLHKSDIADCSEELLNILTGHIMTAYLGRGASFKFEFPEIIYNRAEPASEERELRLRFNAEGEIFELIFINPIVC